MANKVSTFFKNGAKGMAIGVSCIIPGISGGTLALMLGIYKTIVESISNLFKKFGHNFFILLPIMLGIIVGIATLWYPLKLAFQFALIPIVSLFAGFIIGGIPSLVDEVKPTKIKFYHILLAILAFLVAGGIGVASIFFNTNEAITNMFIAPKWYLYIIVFFVGIIASFALIVPGISGSMLLLVLGFYKPILNLIDNFKNGTLIIESLALLASMAIGVLVGFFAFSKLMNYLLDKHKIPTYWVIIGFVVGSVIAIYLNQETFAALKSQPIWMYIISGATLIIGVVGSYLLVVYSRKHKAIEKTN